jgi:DNA mismatch repair protein MutS
MLNREVVRIITQGTLTEDTLLEARENNYLAAFAETGGQFGLSWLDLSTGAFKVQAVKKNEILTAIERINPGEIVVSDKSDLRNEKTTVQPSSLFDSENARLRLEKTLRRRHAGILRRFFPR